MSDTFKPLLSRLADGQTLSEEDAESFFTACFRGEPTPSQVAAALTAMRMRGETVGEITASARVKVSSLRANRGDISVSSISEALASGTFSISR